MALDAPKDTDDVYEIDNFKYLVEKDLLKRLKPIKVDFLNQRFKITCGINLGGGCGSSCGSGASCSTQ